jgi:hypothetical protein
VLTILFLELLNMVIGEQLACKVQPVADTHTA